MATKGDISTLDVLQFGGKPIVPQVAQGGYEITKKSGVIRSDATGGASRQRKKYFGNTYMAQVTFYLETTQQQDFMRLFVDRNEGEKFICHLVADRPIVEPYVVQFADEVSFSEVTAKDSIASTTLEIFSARDKALDETLYYFYNLYGDDFSPVLLSFRQIVEAMPND